MIEHLQQNISRDVTFIMFYHRMTASEIHFPSHLDGLMAVEGSKGLSQWATRKKSSALALALWAPKNTGVGQGKSSSSGCEAWKLDGNG